MSKLPDFEAWAVFATAAQLGSFAKAASKLGVSQATVSKVITRLENNTKSQLFHRTSRQLSLTETGLKVLNQAQVLLEQGKDIEAEINEQSRSLRGIIKLSAPMSYGINRLADVLPAFLQAYPEVELDIFLDDRQTDLVSEGFDLAIRIANLLDSSLIAKGLCQVKLLVVAAPEYLAQYGHPSHPNQLLEHRILHYTYGSYGSSWRFKHPSQGELIQALPRPFVQVNNAKALMPMLLAGLGVALQPDFLVAEQVAAGKLQVILQDWQLEPITLSVITPPGRLRPARVQALIDYLTATLGTLGH